MINTYKVNGITFVGVTEYPPNPSNGDVLYRSDLGKIMTYIDSQWKELGGGSSSGLGVTGVQGVTGLHGDTGIGYQGVTGLQGMQGFTGVGAQGATGSGYIEPSVINNMISKNLGMPLISDLSLSAHNINAVSNLRGVDMPWIVEDEQGTQNYSYDFLTASSIIVNGEQRVLISDLPTNTTVVEMYVDKFGNPSGANPSYRNTRFFTVSSFSGIKQNPDNSVEPFDGLQLDAYQIPEFNSGIYYYKSYICGSVYNSTTYKPFTGLIRKILVNIDADCVLTEAIKTSVLTNFENQIEVESKFLLTKDVIVRTNVDQNGNPTPNDPGVFICERVMELFSNMNLRGTLNMNGQPINNLPVLQDLLGTNWGDPSNNQKWSQACSNGTVQLAFNAYDNKIQAQIQQIYQAINSINK